MSVPSLSRRPSFDSGYGAASRFSGSTASLHALGSMRLGAATADPLGRGASLRANSLGATRGAAPPMLSRRPSLRSMTAPNLHSNGGAPPPISRPGSVRPPSPMSRATMRSPSPSLARSMSTLSIGTSSPATSPYSGSPKWEPPKLVFPCSGAAHPDPNARRSPFLDIAPILEEQSTTCAILIQRVANSYEELARQYPTSDMAVQSHGEFAQQLYTSSNMMLPTLERLVLCLRQLREIADDVSRASGGLLSLTTEGSVSIDIERPDPEGGSHTITAREVLKVVHPESIRATAAKLRHNAQGFVDCGQKLEACAKRLLAGADQFLSTLEPVEMMVLQSAPRIPGPAPPRVSGRQQLKTLIQTTVQLAQTPKSFYSLLGPLSDNPTVQSGIFYNATERKEMFYSYRRLETALSQAVTQSETACAYVLSTLKAAGYLGSAYSTRSVPPPPHLVPTTFMSIEREKAASELRMSRGGKDGFRSPSLIKPVGPQKGGLTRMRSMSFGQAGGLSRGASLGRGGR